MRRSQASSAKVGAAFVSSHFRSRVTCSQVSTFMPIFSG